ncbi:MAG TPA: DUF1810 domain-containing protein [Candidatus Gallacutalibacter pullistercoris]|nr:DUF1810 domain-containing protein [Candidatus Gallacutalibacter pullistercoris]
MRTYDLTRFHTAQEHSYMQALTEIRAGRKTSHWMWYIFPQLRGLGSSEFSYYYGIENLEEAQQFLNDPVLGQRLYEITNALLTLVTNDPHQVMGFPDDRKLCSCMTLFSQITEKGSVFDQVIEKYYHGKYDKKTLNLLEGQRI